MRTLLLALPLGGIALQTSPVQAQPATPLPVPARKSLKPLSAEQKTAIAKLLTLSAQEKLCLTNLDLKVENATLETVIARIGETIPKQKLGIEVRGAKPVRVSFDLEQTTVGNVLDHVAALASCKLFVLGSGLLIAPTSQLTEAESKAIAEQQGGEWAKSTAAGGSSWNTRGDSSVLFTRSIAQEVLGGDVDNLPNGVTKVTLGELSPESQAMLHTMAGWLNGSVRVPGTPPVSLYLDASSMISIRVDNTSKQSGITVLFPKDISVPGALTLGIGSTIEKSTPGATRKFLN